MQSKKLLLVFGRNQELSSMEATAFLESSRTEFKVLAVSKEAMLVEVAEFIKPEFLARELAGTVKVGRVLVEEGISKGFKRLAEKLEAIDFAEGFGKKFNYCISDYGSRKSDELLEFLQGHFKQKFKSQKLKAVLKWPKEVQGERKNTIAPKILAKRIDESMLDFFTFSTEETTLFGRTVAVNNPLEFAKRDAGRPVVKHELVTSARLARILVNIVGLERGKTILDPFCGIGGVMQEIILSGHDALGVERDSENVNACRKNLEWCSKKFSVRQGFKVFNNDSRKLSEFLRKGEFQAVVTEPFMGPFLKKLPSEANAKRIASELQALYSGVFRQLGILMSKGQRVVFIMPQFRTIEGGKVKIGESCFENQGFRKFNPPGSERAPSIPVLYKDSESRIERMIYVLEKV